VYRIYHVTAAKIKPGKGDEAAKWWQEKGKALFDSAPRTKSVKAYAVQFKFGGEYGLEIWREIEDYASFDRLDEDILANPKKYAAYVEAQELLEWGPPDGGLARVPLVPSRGVNGAESSQATPVARSHNPNHEKHNHRPSP